jgi:chromosome segregation ATPase
LNKYLQVVIGVCLITITVAVAVPLITLWPVAGRAEVASRQLLECKGNAACLQSQLLATVGSVKAIAGAVAKAAPEISLSIKAASANSVAASRQTIEVSKAATDVLVSSKATIDELHATVKDLHASVADLTKDAHTLLGSSDGTIKEAGEALVKLGALEDTLNQQIKDGAPEVRKTLEAMAALIDNADLKGILTNADNGTKSLANIADTMDIATRGLRQKAGRVKWVIEKLLNIIKVTIPIY